MNFPLPSTPICAQYSRRQNDPLASLIPQFDWVSLSSFLSSLRFSACWLGPPCQTSVSVLTRVRRLSCIGVPGIPSQPVTNFFTSSVLHPREPFVRLFPFLPRLFSGLVHPTFYSHLTFLLSHASLHTTNFYVLNPGCWHSIPCHIPRVFQRAITATHPFTFWCEYRLLTYCGDYITNSIYLRSCNNVGIFGTISTTICVRSHSAFETPLHEPLAALYKPRCQQPLWLLPRHRRRQVHPYPHLPFPSLLQAFHQCPLPHRLR